MCRRSAWAAVCGVGEQCDEQFLLWSFVDVDKLVFSEVVVVQHRGRQSDRAARQPAL